MDLNMALQLNDAHIREILDVLNRQHPHFYPVCCSLRNLWKLKGAVWVDQWPEFKVVIVRNEHCSDDETQPLNLFYLFAKDDSDLESLFKEPQLLIPGVKVTCFMGLSRELVCRLKTCLQRHPVLKSCSVTVKEALVLCATTIHYDGELPKNFTERKLSPKDSELISLHWLLLPENVRRNYINDCLKVTCSSVCVMKKGQPVAWSLQHIFGNIGLTFVLPQYRRIGLGKYVTAAMAKAIIRHHGYCYVFIDLDNISSKTLHESMGFKRMDAMSDVPGNCMYFT